MTPCDSASSSPCKSMEVVLRRQKQREPLNVGTVSEYTLCLPFLRSSSAIGSEMPRRWRTASINDAKCSAW